jgi:acyl carrier protein
MVYDKICDIICDKMDLEPEQIDADSTFESLHIDSLDMVEIAMDIEDEFNISIEDADDLKTVGDLVDYIERNI